MLTVLIKQLSSIQSKQFVLLLLALTRPNGLHTLDTDTFDKPIGCILLQDQPKEPTNPVYIVPYPWKRLSRNTTQLLMSVSLSYGPSFVNWIPERESVSHLRGSRHAGLDLGHEKRDWKPCPLPIEAVGNRAGHSSWSWYQTQSCRCTITITYDQKRRHTFKMMTSPSERFSTMLHQKTDNSFSDYRCKIRMGYQTS